MVVHLLKRIICIVPKQVNQPIKVGILPSTSLENLTKNIRDLRWLLEKVHVENREYYEIPIRLSNLLMCCGEGAARKEAIQTILYIQNRHQIQISLSLHDCFVLITM